MDKKSPDVRYICRISGWDFKHLAVRGWFRQVPDILTINTDNVMFQSPRGVVVQTITMKVNVAESQRFQSPRGEGVVQTSRKRW